MEPDRSGSKQKRNASTILDGLLHPGRWSRKARSTPSKSPYTSRASTPIEGDRARNGLLDQNSQSLAGHPPLSEGSELTTTDPAPQPSSTLRQNHSSITAITAVHNSTGSVWSGLGEALQKLHIATEFCAPFCAAIDDFLSCLHVFESAANNRQEYHDLTTRLESLVQQLVQHLDSAPSEDISGAILAISEVIGKEIETIGICPSHSGARRVLGSADDNEDILQRYRRIEQLFRHLQGEASMSRWNIASKEFINKQLESLHPAKLAAFDSSLSTEISRRTCTENTRTKVLEESMIWSEDPNAAKIYWMNGMAGTGKTTIACSIATALEARKQLAASFFCTRTSPECREAKRIVPTIAYQLARSSIPFRSALCKTLDDDPDISAKSISSQFDILIKRPLGKVKDKLPKNLVIVVDALDECNDPHIVELFLGLLFRSIGDMPIKFYVTSRPEPIIRNKMMAESERSRSIMYLHEIERSLVQADIELYLKEELAFMAPSENDVKKIAKHAGSLFIYAATVVRFIRPIGKAVDSYARLLAILGVDTGPKQKLSGIDALYTAVLIAGIDDQDLEPEERNHIQLVLWTVICACEPIRISTLSALCGLKNESSTIAALQTLRSVLHVSDRSEHVTTLHASFLDYMFTRERSGEFFCDQTTHSQLLAQRCFEIMQSQLRFNIGSIVSSSIPDSEIIGLGDQIGASISEVLFYTCRFWADHLSMTNPVDNLVNMVHGFLSKHLLFWMEVLNLKKCLTTGPLALTKLNQWLLQVVHLHKYPELLELGSDAYQFIIGYIPSPTSMYTAHIYLSALPLTAPSSSVHRWYLPHFKGLIKVSGPVLDKIQQSTIATWELKHPLCSTSFSPDGGLIVLGTRGGAISVQNAYDGKYLFEPFEAHNKPITSIAISSNGMEMVSGSSDMTLCIWNLQDGSLISGPLRGHIGGVTSVGFSSDGAHIISGSHDCTVGIWKRHGVTIPMKQFLGHTKAVKSVSFSPDGTHTISGSADHTLRVWDLSSETTVFILQGHTGPVMSVQYSPDGAQIFSGSTDFTVRIWNASDGSPSGAPLIRHPNCVTSIAVSPEGGRIASGSFDRTVCVWSIRTGELIAGPFRGHTGFIWSVGFSDDGTRIVSASDDKTVRVWNVHSRTEAHSKETTQIGSKFIPSIRITVSPDNTRFACISSSGVEIWDLQAMEVITSIPLLSKSGVECLQFSPDGSCIYIIHESSIYTCSADTGEMVDGPHSYPPRTHSLKDRLVTCSVDGTRVVSQPNMDLELWDAQSHQIIAYHQLDPDGVPGVQCPAIIFSMKSNRFISQIKSHAVVVFHVWDADSGVRVAGPFLGETAYDISPNGSTVLSHRNTGYRETLHLINVDSGVDTPISIPSTLRLSTKAAKFTPDGLHVVFISGAGCYVWDASNDAVTKIGETWIDNPISLSYSPDGLCLVYSPGQAERLHIDLPCHKNTLRPDGWILSSELQPLVWIPEVFWEVFPMGSGVTCGKDGGLLVDYSNMLVGDNWRDCYIGN